MSAEAFRASPHQWALWRCHGQAPAPWRRAAVEIELQKAISGEGVEDVLRALASVHEVLRTRVTVVDGTLAQVISSAPRVSLTEVAGAMALRDAPLPGAGEIAAWRWERADGGCSLLVSVDPYVADGATLISIARALVYAGAAGGPAPAQYADVAEWMWQMSPAPDALPAIVSALPFGLQSRTIADAFDPAVIDIAAAAAADEALAAWAVVLERLCGLPVEIGVERSAREHPELEGVLGPLTDIVALPSLVESRARWPGLVESANQLLRPRDRDWWMSPDRARPALQFAAPLPLDLPQGARIRTLLLAVPFALRLDVVDREGRHCELHYNRAQLSEAKAQTVAHAVEEVLRRAREAPSCSVAQIGLVGREEREAMLSRSSGPSRPRRETALSMIAARARQRPAASAVDADGRSLSYGELWREVETFAAELRANGVSPDDRIVIALERTPELIVALLATWWLGATPIPMDAATPRVRFVELVESARPRGVIAVEALRDAVASTVTALEVALGGAARAAPRARVAEGALAYIMFTSGSTGRPKGVMVTHAGLANYLAWCLEAYPLQSGGSVPVHTSPGFDLTITSMLAPLAAGGCLAMIPDSDGLTGLAAALAERQELELVKLTPSHLDALDLLVDDEALADSARCLVIGGESLSAASLSRWRRWAPGIRLFNEYGPTETVVGSTTYEVRPEDPVDGSVPIGQPIANTRAYVLDAYLQPLPPAVAGELFIAGAGVALGYFDAPGQTAARFLPDPFASTPGARMYRTGDRCRWRDDDQLEFLGRGDDQVKIRGHRIELAEVEAALSSCEGVAQCAVIARGAGAGVELVAYVQLRAEGNVALDTVREHVAARLPAYMVPRCISLPHLPLTANGKIDRRELAAAAPGTGRVQRPTTPDERRLAAVWRDLLGHEDFDVTSNFFEIGGHSLLALRMLAQLPQSLGAVTLAEFVAAPTIRAIAARNQDGGCRHGRALRLCDGGGPPLFLVHPAGGTVACYAQLAQLLSAQFAVYGIESSDGVAGGGPLPTIGAMAEAYLGDAVALAPRGPLRFAGWSMGGVIALEMARRAHAAGQDVAPVVMIDASVPALVRRREAASLVSELAAACGVPGSAIEGLDVDGALRAVVERSVGLGESPVDVAYARRLLDLVTANVRITAQHRLERYEQPVCLILARQNPRAAEQRRAWTRLCPNLEVHEISASHHELMNVPAVEAVASLLARRTVVSGSAGWKGSIL